MQTGVRNLYRGRILKKLSCQEVNERNGARGVGEIKSGEMIMVSSECPRPVLDAFSFLNDP